MQPDVYGPTAPQPSHAPPRPLPSQSVPPPVAHPASQALIVIAVVVALIVGLTIGVLIGRTTSSVVTTAAPSSIVLGHLHVASKPADGNVVLDGRFVGVSPIEHLELDPGKHSIVIDVFGYQPYAGTLQIEAHGTLNLSVTLAALGDATPTIGTVSGVGVVTHAMVPRSALLPAGGAPGVAPPKPAPSRSSSSSSSAAPRPSAPRRDCSGENSRCNESCRSASTSCDFSCPGCSSCNTSTGWDECKRQCDTCRAGCEQNTKFCESSCDNQNNNCEASQP
ncbi:MAG: PEGA domain-containing protein [Kofleriaceae bacterium]